MANGKESAPQADGVSSPRLRILLVEDNLGDADLVRALLQEARSVIPDVTHVEGLEAALLALDARPPDVVLLDLSLPETQGMETLARVSARAPNIPIVVMTGNDDEELSLKALECGAQGYLVKGEVGTGLLVRTLRHALERQRLVSGLERARERERALATQDALTGLANRWLFTDRLSQAIGAAHGTNRKVAVLLLDIDHMRRLNDSLGHAAGDQLLQRLASRLRACVPQGDTLARLGGDEFAFLLSGLKREVEAARRAEEILDALSAPIRLAEIDCRISASVGVAMFPGDGSTAEELIGNAERAMYQAKERGGARFEFHAPQQGEAARARMELENDLRSALVSGQLLAYFQPKVRVADMRVSGVEALMRWRHPERGFVPPAHFIPVAEEAGLIGKIGDWILHAACAQGAAWQTGPSAGISVAVNVSSRQLEDHRFVSEVHAALERSGLPPACLELEVTESALMRDVGASRRILASLKERGVRVAIDDFGTGYSSLSALRSLPVDCLKIDRSFVSGIAEGATDAKLVCLVIAMAQSLGLETVAEGVETPEQAEFLAAHGCDLLQGYLFSEPLPPEALGGRLEVPMTWESKQHDGGEG